MKEESLVFGVLAFAWVFILSMYFVSRMNRWTHDNLHTFESQIDMPEVPPLVKMHYIRFPKMHISNTLASLKNYPKTYAWIKMIIIKACDFHVQDCTKGIAYHVAEVYHSEMIFADQDQIHMNSQD